MTLTEVCTAIEAETRTRTWAEATVALRVLVIQGIIECLTSEAAGAAKKVRQRKPRKAKTVPLTQHAEASE